jgi:hypothetical protein
VLAEARSHQKQRFAAKISFAKLCTIPDDLPVLAFAIEQYQN